MVPIRGCDSSAMCPPMPCTMPAVVARPSPAAVGRVVKNGSSARRRVSSVMPDAGVR